MITRLKRSETLQILQLLGCGLSQREVAQRMARSIATIDKIWRRRKLFDPTLREDTPTQAATKGPVKVQQTPRGLRVVIGPGAMGSLTLHTTEPITIVYGPQRSNAIKDIHKRFRT
jgi:hypothetical protein